MWPIAEIMVAPHYEGVATVPHICELHQPPRLIHLRVSAPMRNRVGSLIQRPQILFRCLPGFRDLQSVFDVKVRQHFSDPCVVPFTNGFFSRAVLKQEKPRTENLDASVRTLMSAVN